MKLVTGLGLVLLGGTVAYCFRNQIENAIQAVTKKKDDLPEKVEGMIEEAVDLAQGTVEEAKEEIQEELDSHGEESPAPPSSKKGTAKKK